MGDEQPMAAILQHIFEKYAENHVVVCSKSRHKVNAAKLAFAKTMPERAMYITRVAVASGVNAQPVGNEETIQGARNRYMKQ